MMSNVIALAGIVVDNDPKGDGSSDFEDGV